VTERLGGLQRNIDAGNFPPTGPQQALSRELAIELKQALDRVQRYLGRYLTM